MISSAAFYVICEADDAYLSRNRRFWIRPHNRRNPGGYAPTSIGAFSRASAAQIVARPAKGEQLPSGPITLRPAPRCACCGKHEFQIAGGEVADGTWRCHRHSRRNPCAIEGCTRTRASKQPALDAWLCHAHWRRFCPPRSMRRRAYNAYFRRARRYGWTDELRAEFWRFWAALVRSCRRKAAHGWIDKAAIDGILGVGATA